MMDIGMISYTCTLVKCLTRLLRKVMVHGIDGMDWILSWLGEKRQRVVINGSKSKRGQVISEVYRDQL